MAMSIEMESSGCVACGEVRSMHETAFTCVDAKNQVYRYTICPGCGLAMLDPFPDPDHILELYAPDYYGVGETKFSPILERVREAGFRWKVRDVKKLLKSPQARVLDVGCGSGSFLRAISQAGFVACGTEIEGPAYDRASRIQGIHVKNQALAPEMFGRESFDLITLWHVLEHIPDPLETLHILRAMIHSDGWLIIEVPNFGSLQSRCFGPDWFHLDPPLHLYQYTETALNSLLERTGFRVERRSTWSLQMGGFGCLQSVMNKAIRPRDLFYDMLRTRNRCKGGAGAKMLSVLSSIPLAPVSAGFAVIETLLGRGSVLRIECRTL